MKQIVSTISMVIFMTYTRFSFPHCFSLLVNQHVCPDTSYKITLSLLLTQSHILNKGVSLAQFIFLSWATLTLVPSRPVDWLPFKQMSCCGPMPCIGGGGGIHVHNTRAVSHQMLSVSFPISDRREDGQWAPLKEHWLEM